MVENSSQDAESAFWIIIIFSRYKLLKFLNLAHAKIESDILSENTLQYLLRLRSLRYYHKIAYQRVQTSRLHYCITQIVTKVAFVFVTIHLYQIAITI